MDARPAPGGLVVGLPPGPEPFAGRAAELAALRNEARRPADAGCRILVISGRPGSGRTTLARRFARSLPGGRQVLAESLSAPDGAPVDPGAVARRLLAALDHPVDTSLAPGDPQEGAEDPACGSLREVLTGCDTLLLLDDVASAEQLRPLLPPEPRCLVLAATTGPLSALADRHRVDPVILRGLDEPAAVELLTTLVGGTRISCDPVGAAELAEACAGRPAPLRLMAHWLRAHPKAAVPEAAAALREVGGEVLAAAFTLRYRALPVAQARLLRMLTLAPDGVVDLRTASALAGCPAPDAAAALGALAEGELLEQLEPAADGTARYRVPGRFFAQLAALRAELDRPGEVQLARARLLERLVRLVDSARALLDPGQATPDPLPGPLRLHTADHARHWLLGEREPLLLAAEQAIGQGDLDGSAARLTGALLRALPLAGPLAPADAVRLHQLVLTWAERQGAPRRAAAALLNLAELRAAAGQWRPAGEHYRAALAHSRNPLDQSVAARALEGVGECHRALGDAVRAADSYGRALALRRALDDPAAQARLLARIGEAHAAQRRFEEAVREYRAALGLLRRLGDERGTAAVAAALAALARRLGTDRSR
ncbi:tetratricopeptide repeat protein [Kitasatospora kifunensis]|uniref:Tetratricopeptide (TPR) repeat protein n=1 Tax=Kitasatospora kifunensis TaxID=58351 RepID=A0A7W7R639_KITKI|nr:tetratricopeptide repeat protein [Kitasatospora kifunensis]MBB4926088.1 tetratricopeptide (TPR) repeat protein [Kitasatospora kifunensis]